MDAAADMHVPEDWRQAIAEAAGCRRILVLGGTDVGKKVRVVGLGKMWAEPNEGGRRLLEKLEPGWSA